jgi:two-component system response regulator NreC
VAESDPSSRPRVARVAILEPQGVVREGLSALLEREPDVQVIAQAARLDEVLALDEEPEVIVVEIDLREIRGPAVVGRLRGRFPMSAILVLTTVTQAHEVQAVFAAGANGYSLKESPASAVVEAIRRVHRGEGYVEPSLGAALARHGDRPEGASGSAMTSRELEVLRLLALGHTNSEVAERLNVSPRTAEAHRANLVQKLGVHSRAELVRFALEQGYLGRADIFEADEYAEG